MSLVPWRRANPLTSFQQEINNVFDNFFSGDRESFAALTWPSISVKENDKIITVEAEIPGVSKKDIKVNVVRDLLTISGEKKQEKKEEKESFFRMERSYGRFHRQVRLPSTVDAKHAEAQMTDGVLKLKLPKKEAAEEQAITIK